MDYIAFVLSIWILFGGRRKKPALVKSPYVSAAGRWTAGLASMTKPFNHRVLSVFFWYSITVTLYLLFRLLS